MDTPHQVTTYRSTRIPAWTIHTEVRPDGSLLLSAPAAPAIAQNGFVDFLPHWARLRGDTPAFSQRQASGDWRTVTWNALWESVKVVAAALLDLGLSPGKPIMLLSGNSIEQAVMLLAAEYIGIPTAPVSPSYSSVSQDFARLKSIAALLDPAAIFVQERQPFERALVALDMPQVPIIAVTDALETRYAWDSLASVELTPSRIAALASARAAIQPADTLRILFTSGSTGTPKGVPATYGNLKASMAYFAHVFGALAQPQPVFLDWMPWHHTMGGIFALGRMMVTGASYYIDDGKPLPGLFERTLRNLRDISPTIFSSAPSALSMLASELERDPELAGKLFSRLVSFGYGGASLPKDVWERIQRVAERTIGERIAFCTSLGATETNGTGTYSGWPSDDPGSIGVPAPGLQIKLIPLDGGDGRYEIRMRGAALFGGYFKRPDLTAQAFDDEGYLCLGDAVRLVDPAEPARGLRFAGRVVEDFKLTNGTWVRTGAVRLALIAQCSPLVTDAVICGHDREYVAALAWPNVTACRQLAPELASLDAAALVRHPVVVDALRERLRAQRASGASMMVRRILLMAEPPSIDANEIADKGYVNQAACRTRRAHLIGELYEASPAAHIGCA
ncbi:AMP-binding protein [Burkholderia sp. Ac-20365]|nr:AMP-binding protein [Burkholderia sp. Ac-20365]